MRSRLAPRDLAVCLLLSLFLFAARAEALITTIDDVPAATLLLPYFEVDLGDPTGITTLFSVNNASATAILAHVVVWSDLSVPVLDFNVYLTGYDVQSFNLRDLIAHGVIPQTASQGQDPGDVLSPQGVFSQDVNFASCAGQLPIPPLPPSFLAHLQNALTGRFSSLLGGCAGLPYGDNVARGYVTVDTVSNCTLRFPGDLGYFEAGGTGDATNQNVLWGDYMYVDQRQGQNFAEGAALVHIEASATDPETSVSGQYTFYGRYVNWTAVDNREPLATSFAARYLNSGLVGTDLLVWRDSKVKQGAFACGSLPGWYPLGQEGIVIFDEQEHPSVPPSVPVSPQPPQIGILPFPAEAQRTAVGGAAFPVPYRFGWLYLNLNTVVAQAAGEPSEDSAAAQAWVTVLVRQEIAGRLVRKTASGGGPVFDGIQIDCACKAKHNVPK